MTASNPSAPTASRPVDGTLARVRAAALGRPGPVRSWSPVGTVDAGAIGDVDGAGLVQLRGARWSLDWWVGAEDRWHHPAVEAAVRQRPVDDVPVIETAMRVPGGDVVHRAYGVRAGSEGWDDSAVVVEVENSSAVPVAVAFVLRPHTLDGDGDLGAVISDGAVVRVDGRVAMVLSRIPPRAAHGPAGAVAAMLADGEDVDGAAVDVERGPGGVEVAFVVPVPHTAVVRVLLPRVTGGTRRGILRFGRGARDAPAGSPWVAPEADAVVSGWEAHSRDLARVELPEPLLAPLVRASQCSLALAATDHFFGEEPLGASAGTRAAWVAETLARVGLTEPLGPLARALVAQQRLNGTVRLEDGSDATVALVHAAAPLLATGAPSWAEDLVGPVAKAVHRLGRSDGPAPGADDLGASAALARLAPALVAVGQPEVAQEAARLAARTADAPRGPHTPVPAESPLAARAAALRGRIRAGEPDAVADLIDLARVGGPGTVPDRVDDAGVPAGVTGFDPAALAARLAAVLDLALVDDPEGPVLVPAWPSAWWGQPIEAHRIRTRWGLASFGIRWHGERPAVLWEVEPSAGVGTDGPAPVLRAPVLDPAWRGEGWSGEALLAPVEVPPTLVSIRPAASPVASPSPAAPAEQPETESAPPAEGQSFS